MLKDGRVTGPSLLLTAALATWATGTDRGNAK